jgi:hypothetical protein
VKLLYRDFVSREPSIPIFSRDWWLDAVCGADNWDVVIVKKGGAIVASMPYFVKHRHGLIRLVQPPLTQTLGPWLRQSNAKHAKVLGEQKDLMKGLIDQLPSFDSFSQNWHYTNTNWLPFYWSGFKQSTKYTYVLNDISDLEQLWAGFQENIRTDIRKAESRFNLRVRDDVGLDEFLHLNSKTFQRQGLEIPYSIEIIQRLDAACLVRSCRKIFIAEDKDGRHHAGVYMVWDENSAYYIMGGGDPELRNSGATSLCMWEAIQYAGTVTQRFDFEGSMMEPVERFFRGFGAVQAPYFSVFKTPSRLLRVREAFGNIFKSI